MTTRQDDDFLRQLRATFLVEAREHVHVLSSTLLELERDGTSDATGPLVEQAFRSAHSLKGASHAVELASVERLCQSVEDVLAALRDGRLTASTSMLDLMHRAVDAVSILVEATATPPPPMANRPDVPGLRQALRACLQDAMTAAQPATAPIAVPMAAPMAAPERTGPASTRPVPAAPASAWVRIPVSHLEANLLDAEDLLFSRMSARQRMLELRELAAQAATWRRRLGLQVGVEIAEAARALEQRASEAARHARGDFDSLSRAVDAVQGRARRLLYVPFETLSRPFPRLVRELARQQDKQADLRIVGEDVEIDRRIVERLRDPLLHLLRNALDHGIEAPDVRLSRAKPARASLRLTASVVDGRTLRIDVEDDGDGIDLEAVRRRLLSAGVLAEDAATPADDAAVLAHVFDSGLSTRDAVTELSGRGLGLAIVRDAVVKLGGDVRVESRRGQGTGFRLTVPLSLAIERGVLVRVADRLLLIPSRSVVSVRRTSGDAVRTVEGHSVLVDGSRMLPLIDLGAALDLPRSAPAVAPGSATATCIVIGSDARPAALAVDEVLGEQEVVIKPMPDPLAGIPFIEGIAIVGAGIVVPILATAALQGAASRLSASPSRSTRHGDVVAPRHRILVAEDSITSRLLLKAVLESAGHEVRTAVDGRDALAQLQSDDFALLVSDVDMPYLDGCALAARVRAESRLSALPIVLVSARESPQDRARGLEAGANAYLGKRGLDEGELLRIVGGLL